ncbi:MAG TPA: YdcF family protein [Gaiellaceae bacterium]|nr:YdcF family protein [Gaiellaceae bacterium]
MAGAEPRRLVAVFGYSARGVDGLHPLCLLRLRHAEGLAGGAQAVVLSGWSRHGDGSGEAELMRDAWTGPDVPLVCDTTARNTMQNAVGVAALARELGVDELVVVTSHWHARRASALVRAALDDADVSVVASTPRGPVQPRLLARELACLLAFPYQRRRVRTSL